MGHPERTLPLQPDSDLRRGDLSEVDLRDAAEALTTTSFDTRTVWPPRHRLPVGFDPNELLESGKPTPLGVRQSHPLGATGEGVHVAVIDQPLGVRHVEFGHAVEEYV